MLEVISIDNGRNGIKGVSESERIYYPAALGAWRQLRNDRPFHRDDLTVEYEGFTYFAGRVAAEEANDGAHLMLAYKIHKDTKILSLAAAHRLVKDGAQVMLVTGLPISFHNPHDKQKMRELLLGEHQIAVNGRVKSFTIERVEVGAEAATVAWSLGRTRHERFHVVDVGSRTVNFATAINGRWVDRESDSLDYGWETFRGTEEQFARYTIADLSKVLRPLGPIVLIGGKAESLNDHFKPFHSQIEVHPDALFANASAFYELGVIANERQATTR